MAEPTTFQGQSILKPGAYSISNVQIPGGFPLTTNGTILLVGEAAGGGPGSSVGYQTFTSAEFNALLQEYISGPLVDSALAALNPSKTPGIGGFNSVILWKTNASMQASLQLQNATPAEILLITDANWGVQGNFKTVSVAAGSSGKQVILTIKNSQTNVTEIMPQNAAVAQLLIQYVGAGSAATLTIAGASDAAKTLTTVVTGAPSDDLNIPLANYTISSLVAYLQANWAGKYTATLQNTQGGTITPGTDLDPVTALDIKTSAQSLYRLQHELEDIVNQNSKQVIAEVAGINPGTPALGGPFALTGGVAGASANSDFNNGFVNSLSLSYEVAVPCISQDATDDIALGVTDPSSTYMINAVVADLASTLINRASIKNRAEAQGIVGYRKNLKASIYAEAEVTNLFYLQLWPQDVLVVDVNGNLTWKQAHVGAAMLAGMRAGSAVGTPLTHKFLNCVGIGVDVNPATGIDGSDFNPLIDFDPAIAAGVTFAEPAQGGFRVVVDNTTYGVDANFVFNRGSVVNAAIFIAQTVRTQLELLYVGQKISAGVASSMFNTIAGIMNSLLAAQIITPTDTLPLGWDPKGTVVQIVGNTANVQIPVVPVQGLDFILITFNLQNIVQTA